MSDAFVKEKIPMWTVGMQFATAEHYCSGFLSVHFSPLQKLLLPCSVFINISHFCLLHYTEYPLFPYWRKCVAIK
jgi:hypothetical protein